MRQRLSSRGVRSLNRLVVAAAVTFLLICAAGSAFGASREVVRSQDGGIEVLDQTWSFVPTDVSGDPQFSTAVFQSVISAFTACGGETPNGTVTEPPGHAVASLDAGSWPVWTPGDAVSRPIWEFRLNAVGASSWVTWDGDAASFPNAGGGWPNRPDIADPPCYTVAFGFVPVSAGPKTITVAFPYGSPQLTVTLHGIGTTAPLVDYPSPARPTGSQSATLDGRITSGWLATEAHFEWGTSTSYGSSSTPVSVAATGDPQTLSDDATDLKPGTSYHYRLVATNADGSAVGADQTFTTPAAQQRYHVLVRVVGRVRVTGRGIQCPTDCREVVTAGTVERLVAQPAQKNAKITWKHCDRVVRRVCTVAIHANRTVSVVAAQSSR